MDSYSVHVDGKEIGSDFLDVGGFYNILVDDSVSVKQLETFAQEAVCSMSYCSCAQSSQVRGSILTVITANTINLFWLMPQYIVISVAEVMVSVTGLEFSFTQVRNAKGPDVWSEESVPILLQFHMIPCPPPHRPRTV